MNTEQKWREDQLAKALWDAMATGNVKRMRQMLHPMDHAPNGLQTYLEPALSDGETQLRQMYDPQQLRVSQPKCGAQEGSHAGLGTAEAGDSKEDA